MNELSELEEACKHAFRRAGIDGRTSYFAGCIRGRVSIVHQLQEWTRLQPEQIERILKGFVSDRYADYFERRARGLDYDCQAINFLLSQGYKRGLAWRGVPLGKTCWDVSIYQQLLQELKPRTLVEFGTGLGASALFFLDHCRMFGLDTKIITLDVNAKDVSAKMLDEKAIEFIAGDVKDIAEVFSAERLRQLPHPWLIIDDCHTQTQRIIAYFYPLLAPGDYLVIEDVGTSAYESQYLRIALTGLPKATLMVDTFYTDMFGRNLTCSPDAIFRKMESSDEGSSLGTAAVTEND